VIKPEDLQQFHKDTTETNNRMFENYYFKVAHCTGTITNNEPTRHSDLGWYSISNLPNDTMPLVLDLLSKL